MICEVGVWGAGWGVWVAVLEFGARGGGVGYGMGGLGAEWGLGLVVVMTITSYFF